MIKIEQVAVLIQEKIIISYISDFEIWNCKFEKADVASGGLLISEYGSGKTPEGALSSYVSKIKGKKLVFRAMKDDRKEFTMPKDLD